jgi:hypothetical protein
MNKLKILVIILLAALTVEPFATVVLYTELMTSVQTHGGGELSYGPVISRQVPYDRFNQPISNDTEYSLNTTLNGSWELSIQSHLSPPALNPAASEAQIALAPEYRSENLSIPTIIIQMRGDGLLRIEYFAQNWQNTYGLVLYNSTSPGWLGAQNITLRFMSFGPPVPVNPQLAPRPNGNLTIIIGESVALTNYPIAWANLSSFYVYGLLGSAFVGGIVRVTAVSIGVKS